jgi:hypothetical protein
MDTDRRAQYSNRATALPLLQSPKIYFVSLFLNIDEISSTLCRWYPCSAHVQQHAAQLPHDWQRSLHVKE